MLIGSVHLYVCTLAVTLVTVCAARLDKVRVVAQQGFEKPLHLTASFAAVGSMPDQAWSKRDPQSSGHRYG